VPEESKSAPVVLRIKLRYDDVDTMVQRFAAHVGKSGLFLPTKALQPVGTEVKFELKLANDTPVLVGLGRVKSIVEPGAPKAAFGMAIELMRVTRESRELILRMLERRRALGLPELALPQAADVDAARAKEAGIDTGVRDTSSSAVPQPSALRESVPDLLTAPRRTGGPVATAKVLAVAPLAPEPARARRPAVSELIEQASGPVMSTIVIPDLDVDVDLAAVLARARVLAGGSVDEELDALLADSAASSADPAAPREISVEAASAALAAALGGKAVARADRSVPAEAPVVEALTAESRAAESRGEPAAESRVAESRVVESRGEPAADDDAADDERPSRASAGYSTEPVPLVVLASDDDDEPRAQAVTSVATNPEITAMPMLDGGDDEDEADPRGADLGGFAAASPTGVLIADDGDPDDLAAQMRHAAEGEHEVEADQIADEIEQLDDEDLEEVEQTQLGEMPATATGTATAIGDGHGDGHGGTGTRLFGGYADTGYESAEYAESAARLDDELAAAEGDDDLGFSEHDFPAESTAFSAERPFDDEAPAIEAPAYPSDPPGYSSDPPGYSSDPPDDFEILAEANAEDADLLAAEPAETDAPTGAITAEPATGQREWDYSRLDLGEDSESDLFPRGGDHVQYAQPLADEPEPEPEPEPTGIPPLPAVPGNVEEDYDLETALEALDVDLDDLSIPHAATELNRGIPQPRSPIGQPLIRPPTHLTPAPESTTSRSRAPTQGRLPRASTDGDGILIDFDDDESKS
jgi:hypothetical protein